MHWQERVKQLYTRRQELLAVKEKLIKLNGLYAFEDIYKDPLHAMEHSALIQIAEPYWGSWQGSGYVLDIADLVENIGKAFCHNNLCLFFICDGEIFANSESTDIIKYHPFDQDSLRQFTSLD